MKAGLKVNLARSKLTNRLPSTHYENSVSRSLPFYKSRRGEYHHRVRSIKIHWRSGDLSHTSLIFMCGNSGFIGEKGTLIAKVPDDGVLCATCEGRYVGAGLGGERLINGKRVMYSPMNKQEIKI